MSARHEPIILGQQSMRGEKSSAWHSLDMTVANDTYRVLSPGSTGEEAVAECARVSGSVWIVDDIVGVVHCLECGVANAVNLLTVDQLTTAKTLVKASCQRFVNGFCGHSWSLSQVRARNFHSGLLQPEARNALVATSEARPRHPLDDSAALHLKSVVTPYPFMGLETL